MTSGMDERRPKKEPRPHERDSGAVSALISVIVAFVLVFAVAGCTARPGGSAEDTSGTVTPSVPETSSTGSTAVTSAGVAASLFGAHIVSYSKTDLDAAWDAATASLITLSGDSARFDGVGGATNGSTVTISAGGTYVVSGTLDDGQIIIDLEEDDTVRLVLNGAKISCSDSAPLYVKNADKVVVVLADGTENILVDGDLYEVEQEDPGEPDAAVFSKSDLTINGAGSLVVHARYDNGIVSKDDLKIVDGTIVVDAANDALKGRDRLGVRGGVITVNAGGDGLQSTNDEDASLGYISIEGGLLDITAGTDGIQAQTTLTISGGEITLSTGGGSANGSSAQGQPGGTWGDWGKGPQSPGSQTTAPVDAGDPTSAKGLKAGSGVYVLGGSLDIDSSDDSIHSDTAVQIDDGTIRMASGDDGIHADSTLVINGGELTVAQSYEGMESAEVTVDGGTIHVTSSDDGINVAGGVDESSVSGRPGQGEFTVNENNTLHINGGYVVLDANGDGLDCNGRVFMTDGTVLITGPTNDGNGAIDYLGEFTVTGGFLVAVGSSGMAQAVSESSTQGSILVNFDSVVEAGVMLHVEDQRGEDIATFVPTKRYQSVLVCSPLIAEGSSLTVYLGGTSTGVGKDDLHLGGVYTPGTEYVTLEITGVVTTHGTGGGMMPGGMMPGGGTLPGGGTKPGGGTQPGGGGGRP